MKKKKEHKISYWSICIIGLLLALMVPSMAAKAAKEGTLTIKKFRVEDYENLKQSTGQSSDITNVPGNSETIAGVEFQINKLLVKSTDKQVTTSTPVDSSFPTRVGKTDTKGEVTFEKLPEGYYLVSEHLPRGYTSLDAGKFVVRIPNKTIDASGNESTNYDVVVYPKGHRVQVEKTVNSAKEVVGIGDVITWNVVYPLGPDLKREEVVAGVTVTSYGKNFYLTDEMDTRLDYVEGSVEFTYYDANKKEIALALSEGVDYHLTYNEATHVLRIDFTDNVGTKKVADANVAYIGMKLGTRVNASALDTVEVLWNNARISFENASGDPYEHEVFPPGTNPDDNRVPKVHLGQIAITKVAAHDKSIRLAGATFYLADSKENAEKGNFLKRSGTSEDIKVTTDDNGEARIEAVGAGTYYLVETKAPQGYIKMQAPIEVVVANDGNQNIVQIEITNVHDGVSPGGPGDGSGNGPGDGNGNGDGSGNDPNGSGNGSGNGDGSGGLGSGGKGGWAGGVNTGDVVRMTGVLFLAIASLGIILGIVRKQKEVATKVA